MAQEGSAEPTGGGGRETLLEEVGVGDTAGGGRSEKR